MINAFHPAMLELLRLQAHGRRRRIWNRFCQPRRMLLSGIACVLAIVWLGNAAMTVWLREAASPETLRALLSLGLALYAGWHFASAAFFRPESPFDWTPDEREILAAMPLRRRDLVAYQIASVTITTFLKAGLFTLLLLPDLRSALLGLLGVTLAMLALEMLRMAIGIAAWGMSRTTFLVYRAMVVAGLVVCGVMVGGVVVGAFHEQINIGEGLLQRLLDILVQLSSSVFAYPAVPFQPLIDIILAETITLSSVVLSLAAASSVFGLAAAVAGLYAVMSRRMAERERSGYRLGPASGQMAGASEGGLSATPKSEPHLRLRRIPRWGGASALAWRQLVGAGRHRGSLLTAMIAPAVLVCFPAFVIEDPLVAFLATSGTLAFYTFLLLPTALRFDFRRDLDRLAAFKCLPVTPAAATFGQTLVPVLIATVFQAAVLAFVVAARSLPASYLFAAMSVMIPLNALVFGFDNLIFLLYPYRLQQEGLEVFVRTMLTFTGKGLVSTIALAVISLWGFATADVTRVLSRWTGAEIDGFSVFAIGLIAGLCFLAALVFHQLCRTYRRLSPIEDLPR